MENKKHYKIKMFASVLFALAVLGLFAFLVVDKHVLHKLDAKLFRILSYACIGACFVFSVLFIKFKNKNVFITLALAANVAADYFLVLMPSDENKLIGLYVFCCVQFFYLVYTLFLSKGIGLKIANIAVRVALCLVAYFVLPKFVTLGTLELVAVIYIINSVVTLLALLVNLKTQWIMFIGFLLFVVCDVFVGLTNGGVEILQITGPFVEFLAKYDIAFYCYTPGIFLIALHSVWRK